MISGRQALARLEQAIRTLREREAQLQQAWHAAAEEAARLRVERTEAFRQLARLKLDALTRNEVDGELDGAERQALALIESRRKALNALRERRRAAEQEVQEAERRRHGAAEALERALADLDALRKSVEAQARISPEWTTARARVDELARMAEQAQSKAVQAETDREQKRKPYEADPLFMYLWQRKFGSPEYRVGHLTRFMDRLVARAVGYDKARANYSLLNEIPDRLREHAQRIGAELREAQAQLTSVERAALAKAGTEAAETRAADARAALEEADRRLHDARSLAAGMDRAYEGSVSANDTPFREAIDVLAAADERQDLKSLYEEALRTPTREDEQIVRQLQTIDTKITAAVRRAVDAHQQLQETAGRRATVEQEWSEFRRRGYDNPSGSFGNEGVLGNVLGGILTGAISGAVLGEVLRGGFHQGPSPWDSDFGGGLPFPQPGGSDDGGSIGGGGDFETGGSF
jgi:hypothetical protein